jgi:hypothetical protein
MNTKHTPAPWRLFKATDAKPHLIFLRKEIGSIEIDHFGWIDPDKKISAEMLANARLIAAAPELLDILQKLADADFGSKGWTDYLEVIARQARLTIAKATGEQA